MTMEKKDNYVYPFDGGLYLNITNRCCNACSFCIRRGGEGIKGNSLILNREPALREVIEQIDGAEFSYDRAVFCGYGEPTYRMDILPQIAEYLKNLGVPVRLNTNGLGRLINGRDIIPDLKGKLNEISVSLNAGSAEEYLKLCAPKYGLIAFDEVIRFAADCAAAGIKTIMTAVDVIDKAELDKCRKLASLSGVELRVRQYISDNEQYK